jgi:hypothetical protein
LEAVKAELDSRRNVGAATPERALAEARVALVRATDRARQGEWSEAAEALLDACLTDLGGAAHWLDGHPDWRGGLGSALTRCRVRYEATFPGTVVLLLREAPYTPPVDLGESPLVPGQELWRVDAKAKRVARLTHTGGRLAAMVRSEEASPGFAALLLVGRVSRRAPEEWGELVGSEVQLFALRTGSVVAKWPLERAGAVRLGWHRGGPGGLVPRVALLDRTAARDRFEPRAEYVLEPVAGAAPGRLRREAKSTLGDEALSYAFDFQTVGAGDLPASGGYGRKVVRSPWEPCSGEPPGGQLALDGGAPARSVLVREATGALAVEWGDEQLVAYDHGVHDGARVVLLALSPEGAPQPVWELGAPHGAGLQLIPTPPRCDGRFSAAGEIGPDGRARAVKGTNLDVHDVDEHDE